MSWVGFEPTIPAIEGAQTVHVLDRAATVISYTITTTKIITQPPLLNIEQGGLKVTLYICILE
jgi:hypothetical protein